MPSVQREPAGDAPRWIDARQEVCDALSHGLDLPVAALRASMESLCTELAGSSVREPMLRSALEEVNRLGHNVQELVDYATPPNPRPLRCSVREILAQAARAADGTHRPRLILAQEEPRASLMVDGPMLAGALRRLVQNAFEAGAHEVLVSARRRADHTVFTVLDRASAAFDAAWAQLPFHSSKPNQLGLGLTLVKRDVELLGGTLEIHGNQPPTCVTSVVVTVPDAARAASWRRIA